MNERGPEILPIYVLWCDCLTAVVFYWVSLVEIVMLLRGVYVYHYFDLTFKWLMNPWQD